MWWPCFDVVGCKHNIRCLSICLSCCSAFPARFSTDAEPNQANDYVSTSVDSCNRLCIQSDRPFENPGRVFAGRFGGGGGEILLMKTQTIHLPSTRISGTTTLRTQERVLLIYVEHSTVASRPSARDQGPAIFPTVSSFRLEDYQRPVRKTSTCRLPCSRWRGRGRGRT